MATTSWANYKNKRTTIICGQKKIKDNITVPLKLSQITKTLFSDVTKRCITFDTGYIVINIINLLKKLLLHIIKNIHISNIFNIIITLISSYNYFDINFTTNIAIINKT